MYVKYGDPSCISFEMSCGKEQTDRHTDKRRQKPYPATSVGVANDGSVDERSDDLLLLGFSLNGELMMDRMGQEIAFKGIDLTCLYVPAFSLSVGQHARVNFGQVRSAEPQLPIWLM